MCNGFSTRKSQGGSIAVLRRTDSYLSEPSPASSPTSEEWQLLFSNNAEDLSRTQVEFRASDSILKQQMERYWVVIHRNGDLGSSPGLPPTQITSNPFFSFPLAADESSVTHLPQKLDLGVGDSGVIGRKVSIMRGRTTVAEGIMGWN
ncbi:hypothetical protein P154DRAFT_528860 [Amniculicola lignicola CBS 123094]|uniref:Uncharacterized protein n=1 Tax=Amniculicola lignicola CBS 123094 TaxID=1392246 RepID=A0A6A5X1T0_9PLEO|nr:hypothetical protein P154DRAFT_528860 [Amniculicola lignicola CBS 123094]